MHWRKQGRKIGNIQGGGAEHRGKDYLDGI